MNITKLADLILKESDKFESKVRFENEEKFNENVNNFINSINSKMVNLKLNKSAYKETPKNQIWQLNFQIIFILDDPYIDSKTYSSGSVFIFPSKKLYDDIDKFSMKLFSAYPQWDETKTNATITGNAKVY